MTVNVTADERRQIIDRIEQMNAEIADLTESRKEIYDEAKGQGYDTSVIRKVIALRKLKPDARAEMEAIMAMYQDALGM